MSWQVHDAQGNIRFASDEVPIDTKEQAESYIALFNKDHESHRDFPEWFPMVAVEVL